MSSGGGWLETWAWQLHDVRSGPETLWNGSHSPQRTQGSQQTALTFRIRTRVMLPRPGTGLSGYCPPGTGEAVPPRFRASAHTEKVGLVMRGWLSGLPGGGTARWGPEHPDGTLLIQPTLREHVGSAGVLSAHVPLPSAHTWGPTRASCHCVDTGRQSGGPPCRAYDEGTGRLRGEGRPQRARRTL